MDKIFFYCPLVLIIIDLVSKKDIQNISCMHLRSAILAVAFVGVVSVNTGEIGELESENWRDTGVLES
jgi:hypothetical protein